MRFFHHQKSPLNYINLSSKEGIYKAKLANIYMERRTLWSRIKGLFLIAGAMSASLKGAPAFPAKYIIQKEEEHKKQEIKEKHEAMDKHKSIYPCQRKCLPRSMQFSNKASQFK